jgi:hypothetical protein
MLPNRDRYQSTFFGKGESLVWVRLTIAGIGLILLIVIPANVGMIDMQSIERLNTDDMHVLDSSVTLMSGLGTVSASTGVLIRKFISYLLGISPPDHPTRFSLCNTTFRKYSVFENLHEYCFSLWTPPPHKVARQLA